MLSFDLATLQREIDAAEDFRDRHITEWRRLIERYHGPAFKPGADSEDDPENFVHEYVALLLPRIIHDSPKIRVKSARPVTQGQTAPLMQVAMNRWVKMTKMRRTLERIAVDMLLGFGIGMVVNEPRKGYRASDDADPFLPRLYRISPDRFFIDPAATNPEDARYMGHCWTIDKEDLLAMADAQDGWNRDVIEAMGSNSGIDELRGDLDTRIDIPDRKELVLYEVWVPEVRDASVEALDMAAGGGLFNGTIYTVLKGQSSNGKATYEFAREPRPYWGPRSGPYTIFGVYTVPDDPYPLSPILALVPQMDDVNAHLRAMRYSASAYKRIVAVDSRNPKLAQDIRDKDDLFVVMVDGLDPTNVVPLEVGGITQQQVAYSQQAQDRLDRVSGIHDAMRGNITGQPTATEIAIAESSSGLRMAHLKKQYQEAVNDALLTAAWYLFHDQKVMFPLGQDGVAVMGEAEPIFSPMVLQGTFDDLELEIEAMSMERVSEAVMQRRAIELLQVIGNISQSVMAAPHVKWREVMSLVGDALNIPTLGDLIDVTMANQMRAGAAQGAAMQASQQKQGESPQALMQKYMSRTS